VNAATIVRTQQCTTLFYDVSCPAELSFWISTTDQYKTPSRSHTAYKIGIFLIPRLSNSRALGRSMQCLVLVHVSRKSTQVLYCFKMYKSSDWFFRCKISRRVNVVNDHIVVAPLTPPLNSYSSRAITTSLLMFRLHVRLRGHDTAHRRSTCYHVCESVSFYARHVVAWIRSDRTCGRAMDEPWASAHVQCLPLSDGFHVAMSHSVTLSSVFERNSSSPRGCSCQTCASLSRWSKISRL
jgi:hypothetical protein